MKQLEQADGQQFQPTEEPNAQPQASSALDAQINMEPQAAASPFAAQSQSHTWTGDQPTIQQYAAPPQQIAPDNAQLVPPSTEGFAQPQMTEQPNQQQQMTIQEQQIVPPQMTQGQPMMPPPQMAPQQGQMQQPMMQPPQTNQLQPPTPMMPGQQQQQMAPPPPPSPWEGTIPPAMQPTDWQPEPAASWEPKAQTWGEAAQQQQPKPEAQKAAWQPEPPTSWEPTTSSANQDWDWQGQKPQETVPPVETPPAVQWETPSPAPEPQSQWRPAPQPSGQWTQAPNQSGANAPAWGARTRGNRKELPKAGAQHHNSSRRRARRRNHRNNRLNGLRLLRRRISKPGGQLRSWAHHQQVNSLRAISRQTAQHRTTVATVSLWPGQLGAQQKTTQRLTANLLNRFLRH